MTSTNINDLPDEVLEFIFGHMPPYKDLESCALVCKRWTIVVRSKLANRISVLMLVGLRCGIDASMHLTLDYFFLLHAFRCTTAYNFELQQRLIGFSLVLETMEQCRCRSNHCGPFFTLGHRLQKFYVRFWRRIINGNHIQWSMAFWFIDPKMGSTDIDGKLSIAKSVRNIGVLQEFIDIIRWMATSNSIPSVSIVASVRRTAFVQCCRKPLGVDKHIGRQFTAASDWPFSIHTQRFDDCVWWLFTGRAHGHQ